MNGKQTYMILVMEGRQVIRTQRIEALFGQSSLEYFTLTDDEKIKLNRGQIYLETRLLKS